MKSKFLLLTIIAISLLSFPKINFGQAINLGAAADFVLFTKNGALNDNAVAHSHLTGDVGYEIAGSFLGFGNVNGVMRDGVDAKTTAAGIALPNAITAINGKTVDFFPASGTLGNGDTLIAGVYSIVGDATQNLNLYLDAKGDPSAEFIIKISGKFEPAALSKVILINSAQACHVFWKVDGVVSMATGVVMKGNILGGAAINMATLDTLEGRLLTTVGAITIDGILAYTPLCEGEPLLTGPKAPDLGSIACYTIFSSTGALSNTIPTNISGDVGKDNDGASITGWNQSYISPGTLHPVRDASTVQAALDLSDAYDSLNLMTEDIELLYPNELGNGLVLTPHTYLINSAGAVGGGPGPAQITDTIYFDAQGNPDGVFVIQVRNGALSAVTGSNVKLINGAQSKNIYWMVQGAMNINNNCIFRGTIIIGVGAVNMVNTNILLDGRALTMSGLITTTGLTASSSCAPPIITLEPNDITVCSGSTASFSVTQTAGVSYEWRKGNVTVNNGINVSGATTATLTINSATISDTSSFYNVIVKGTSLPNDTSNMVSLTVNQIPTITMQPSDKTVCSGSAASFTVAATGTGLTYRWRKGIVNLNNGINISGVTTPTLTFNSATASDTAYNYNVVISGTCLPNQTSNMVALVVNQLPIITMQPSDKTVCSGSSASYTVAVTGTGVTYRWRKGIVNLNNGINISGVTTPTLTFNNATASDTAYNYNVVVSGTCLPNQTSTNVSLVVNELPNITMQPSDKTVCAGSQVSFTVSATGTGLTYQWKKGITNVSNGINISGAMTPTLTFNSANVSDTAYNYNVVITGTCLPNATSVNASLLVNPIPVATANSNSPVCIDDTLNLTAQTVIGASYNWTGPNGYASTAQDSLIIDAAASNSGTYSLTVSQNGCTSTVSTVTVSVNDCSTDLSVVKTVDKMTPFIGRTVVFTLVATNNGPLNATGVAVSDPLQNGYAYVSSTATSGSYDSATGVWTIGTFSNGASATLTITATVLSEGNYVNTAIVYGNEIDLNMVNNVSSIEPIPTDFNIPEGFSPNADGINDVFVIRGILNYPENTFAIFNRWGNKVFESNSYKNTWDGTTTLGLTIGGDELPVGTYFYILDLGDGSDIYKGTIYLNR